MKRFYFLFLLIAVIMAAGFWMAWNVWKAPVETVDMGAVNHIVNSVQNYEAADSWPAEIPENEFKYDFVIFFDSGEVYTSGQELPESVSRAIKRGFITADAQSFPGKIMIDPGLGKQYEKRHQDTAKWILEALLTVSLGLLLYFGYLYRVILHPFRRLTVFARQITDGRLDSQLPMDRHNIFGAFTESFDLMREALREARHREMAANQSKNEMIASLSHDIKTPVTSIRLLAEFLQVQTTEAGQLEKLNAIEVKTKQIDYLMNNLLQNTLEDLGHLEVICTDEESRILLEIVGEVHIKSAVTVTTPPICLIQIDKNRMGQIISNILYNAEKYAAASVIITFAMADPFLQMDIHDYGKGVKETEIEYLCEKFYRGQTATESGKEGEGLGLYISRSLMNKMNGELICINKPDGFTVRLMIPLSR